MYLWPFIVTTHILLETCTVLRWNISKGQSEILTVYICRSTLKVNLKKGQAVTDNVRDEIIAELITVDNSYLKIKKTTKT